MVIKYSFTKICMRRFMGCPFGRATTYRPPRGGELGRGEDAMWMRLREDGAARLRQARGKARNPGNKKPGARAGRNSQDSILVANRSGLRKAAEVHRAKKVSGPASAPKPLEFRSQMRMSNVAVGLDRISVLLFLIACGRRASRTRWRS